MIPTSLKLASGQSLTVAVLIPMNGQSTPITNIGSIAWDLPDGSRGYAESNPCTFLRVDLTAPLTFSCTIPPNAIVTKALWRLFDSPIPGTSLVSTTAIPLPPAGQGTLTASLGVLETIQSADIHLTITAK